MREGINMSIPLLIYLSIYLFVILIDTVSIQNITEKGGTCNSKDREKRATDYAKKAGQYTHII